MIASSTSMVVRWNGKESRTLARAAESQSKF
jgi:hypothetical protein